MSTMLMEGNPELLEVKEPRKVDSSTLMEESRKRGT
jgi:tRNA U54 and U55 pseudouridine synthase Pus10